MKVFPLNKNDVSALMLEHGITPTLQRVEIAQILFAKHRVLRPLWWWMREVPDVWTSRVNSRLKRPRSQRARRDGLVICRIWRNFAESDHRYSVRRVVARW